MPLRRKYFSALMLLLVLASGSLGFFRTRVAERLERQVFDRHMAAMPALSSDSGIVIIAAGEKSLESLGRWPWRRETYARLLGKLSDSKAVMIDILLSEEGDPVGDQVLAEVVRLMGNVVTAMHYVTEDTSVPRAVLPFDSLLSASGQMGFTNVNPDIDGLFRYSTPFRRSGDSLVPSFSVAALPLILGERPGLKKNGSGGMILEAGGRSLPLDKEGRLWIRFSREPFPEYEFVDVLEGRIPPETFRDRIVLVGATAAGLEDYVMVPGAEGISAIPGVRFQAEILNTLLQGGVPKRLPDWSEGLISAAAALAGAFLAGFTKPRRAVAAAIALLASLLLASRWMFISAEIWLATVCPVLAMTISFTLLLFVRYRLLHRDWEVQTLSIGSIYDLVRRDTPEVDGFASYLRTAWPSVERDLGIKLISSPMTQEDALSVIRAAGRDALKDGEILISRERASKPKYRMLVQTSLDPETKTPAYSLVGWERRIAAEQVKSVAVWIMSSSWFYGMLEESERNRKLLFDTIRAMITALDAKDPATAGHSERVSALSVEIAERLGLEKEMVDAISLGSVIHDVGKIGIPDRILGKEGPLTAGEYEIVKQHASIGKKILETVSLPEAARRSLANHHERLDGSGYPRALRGEEIDMASRIIAAADVFDAIISDRPYSRPWSLEDACQHMHDGSGRQFDEDVIRVLLEIKAPTGWSPKK